MLLLPHSRASSSLCRGHLLLLIRVPVSFLEVGIAMPGMKGGKHGPSIKNSKVYEGLRKKGMSKSKAAAISNAMKKGGKRRKKK